MRTLKLLFACVGVILCVTAAYAQPIQRNQFSTNTTGTVVGNVKVAGSVTSGTTNLISDSGSSLNNVGLTNGAVTASTVTATGAISSATLTNSGSAKIGNAVVVANWNSGGTWIDLPTGGPSGIGVGGAGENPFVAYASGAGQWFLSSQAGDTVVRAKNTRLLLGASNGTIPSQITISNAGSGAGVLFSSNVFFNATVTIRTNTAEPAAVAGAAQLYSLDVSGQSEMFAQGSDGLETQISSHPKDAPPALYDVEPFDLTPYMVRDANPYITNGAIRFVNVTRMARQTELMNRAILYLLGTRNLSTSNAVTKLLAQTPAERQVLTRESYAEYNARTGSQLTPKVWEAEQAKLQAEYNANRAAAIATNAIYVAEGNTNLLAVPPAVDIRRPKPVWLTK